MTNREVVIAAACRTAVGTFMGALADIPSSNLGSTVVTEALRRAGVEVGQVDELIMGSVLTSGFGQNIARQIGIAASLPQATPAFTVSKVCGSGLKSVILAAQSIMCGDADVIVAGGVENMSASAFLAPG